MNIAAIVGTVSGRVQDVGFRYAMREEALRLGVVGWVRNLPDGSVAFHAQGARADLDALTAWCRTGPPFARVDNLETHASEAAELPTFEILR